MMRQSIRFVVFLVPLAACFAISRSAESAMLFRVAEDTRFDLLRRSGDLVGAMQLALQRAQANAAGQDSPVKPVSAGEGMWYIGVNMCGTEKNTPRCVNDVLVKEMPNYVSRSICEMGAQQFVNEMRGTAMDVKRAWCEERANLP